MVPGIKPPPDWFSLPTIELARNLLGTYLIHDVPEEGPVGGIIDETEAYLHDDPASHSYHGRTSRNASMFDRPGTVYVYLIYGIHNCINVVSAPRGTGEAILIRSILPRWSISSMKRRRGTTENLCNGPGRLCQALGIAREDHDGTHFDASGPLYIRFPDPDEPVLSVHEIDITRRVGISKGAEKLLRFVADTTLR